MVSTAAANRALLLPNCGRGLAGAVIAGRHAPRFLPSSAALLSQMAPAFSPSHKSTVVWEVVGAEDMYFEFDRPSREGGLMQENEAANAVMRVLWLFE